MTPPSFTGVHAMGMWVVGTPGEAQPEAGGTGGLHGSAQGVTRRSGTLPGFAELEGWETQVPSVW